MINLLIYIENFKYFAFKNKFDKIKLILLIKIKYAINI